MSDELHTAWMERCKLSAEGNKLYAEGNKLSAEGDNVFLSAVLAVVGNTTVEWFNWDFDLRSYSCRLGTGEVFTPTGGENVAGESNV